jgi:beta-glucosidase
MDFLGLNYYSRSVVSADGSWSTAQSGLQLTDMGWEIYPDGLTELLLRLHADYPVPPLYVKENGGAFRDRLVDGQVHDLDRTAYLAAHIAAVGDAMRQGVPMAGYMVWSLLDNFEWASGYDKRFGIVHVDYATQRRTLKDSARWYRAHLQQQHARRAAAAGTLAVPAR